MNLPPTSSISAVLIVHTGIVASASVAWVNGPAPSRTRTNVFSRPPAQPGAIRLTTFLAVPGCRRWISPLRRRAIPPSWRLMQPTRVEQTIICVRCVKPKHFRGKHESAAGEVNLGGTGLPVFFKGYHLVRCVENKRQENRGDFYLKRRSIWLRSARSCRKRHWQASGTLHRNTWFSMPGPVPSERARRKQLRTIVLH